MSNFVPLFFAKPLEQPQTYYSSISGISALEYTKTITSLDPEILATDQFSALSPTSAQNPALTTLLSTFGSIIHSKPESGDPLHSAAILSDSGYESMKKDGDLSCCLSSVQEERILKGGCENDLRNSDSNDFDDFDDAATTYSVALSLAEEDINTYKAELSETIFNNVRQNDPTVESLEALGEALPSLLRCFALRLGSPGSSKTEKEIMDIANRFHNAVKDIHGQEALPERQMEAIAKLDINQWLQDLGDEDNMGTDLQNTSAGEDIEEQPSVLDKRGYRDAVFSSVAYRWLMAALLKTLALAPVDTEDFCTQIQQNVSKCFEQHRSVSSREASKRYTMAFSVDWDPVTFLHEQFEDYSDIERLLGETLTLTGSITDAQALPCAEYLLQTWPTIGPTLLELMKAALTSNKAVHVELEDKSIVTCHFVNSKLEAQVEGTADSIATVCEIFGWLGAALRPSCSASGLATCRPQIQVSTSKAGPARCIINYPVIPVALAPQDSKRGQCWHSIFRNPVIAVGYPIPRRNQSGLGLEIPLNVMAGLTMSRRIHKYMGRHFLKGYSIALVPTEKVSDMILWHLYYSEDGNRLPYPNLDDMDHAALDLQDLTAGRHIVGWCSEAKLFAGAPGMNYVIKSSQLERPGREFALEKVSFSIGQIVTGGCQFSIGRKDSPVKTGHDGYIAKLRWLNQKYVTLWDVEEERGWLVNGTAALLHLLRASLQHSKTDRFKSEFLFQEGQFQESQNPGSHQSVLDVLLNQTNQKLKLYRKEDHSYETSELLSNGQLQTAVKTVVSWTTIKDRVEELYDTLEKLFDHNAASEASFKGINAKPRIKDYLEGWDFADIATDRDSFLLRRAKLPLSLLGWADLTRAIPAITLFGRGFGDIIRASEVQPSKRPTSCSEWETVPKNGNFLCVTATDLRDIIDRIGEQATNPITVAPGILWTNPTASSPFHKNCSCDPKGKSLREPVHHAIQKLVSSKLHSFVPKSVVDLDSHQKGAVIFGSPERRLRWSLSGAASLSESESYDSVPLGNSDTSHQPDTSNSSSQSPFTSTSVMAETPDSGTFTVGHGSPIVGQVSPLQVLTTGGRTQGPREVSEAVGFQGNAVLEQGQGGKVTAVKSKRKGLAIPDLVASLPKRLKRS
ncbi:hypothetical protein NW762_007892 [Fusarium torreyae]|uniref:Uncharacterized protein n=1 Tax=Fusarium torreyae TaxID=1237075 RepID=A0A9W8VCL9_9HYPO|nr:hypothetical protein NW762_007892 [Fusarium torreyae]